MDTQQLAYLCRQLVLIVLLVAAYSKSANISAFGASLVDGFSMPAALGRYAALTITGAEWLAAAGLLLGSTWARYGAELALALFIVFTLAVAQVIITRRLVSCRCFGKTAHTLSFIDLTRNSIYITVAASYLALRGSTVGPTDNFLTQLSLGLVAMLCFLLSANMQDIKNLLR
jgi:hypothetical protein